MANSIVLPHGTPYFLPSSLIRCWLKQITASYGVGGVKSVAKLLPSRSLKFLKERPHNKSIRERKMHSYRSIVLPIWLNCNSCPMQTGSNKREGLQTYCDEAISLQLNRSYEAVYQYSQAIYTIALPLC